MFTVYGAIASICAMWMLHVTRQHHLDAGYMSCQWLEDYRARHFD
jgi:hypothetical protein